MRLSHRPLKRRFKHPLPYVRCGWRQGPKRRKLEKWRPRNNFPFFVSLFLSLSLLIIFFLCCPSSEIRVPWLCGLDSLVAFEECGSSLDSWAISAAITYGSGSVGASSVGRCSSELFGCNLGLEIAGGPHLLALRVKHDPYYYWEGGITLVRPSVLPCLLWVSKMSRFIGILPYRNTKLEVITFWVSRRVYSWPTLTKGNATWWGRRYDVWP